jgi:hypothetical protein
MRWLASNISKTVSHLRDRGDSSLPVVAVARRLPLSLCLGLLMASAAIGLYSPCFADTESDLARLENKFFQHTYPKDSEPDRLERLEKMVFGEAKTGSDSDRLGKLVDAVPVGKDSSGDAAQSGAPASSASSTASSGGGSSSGGDDSRTAGKKPYNPPTETADNDDPPVKTDEKYPAVTAIEQKVLGRDYVGEPVEKRLARLEVKKFGKATSNSVDLSDRVDALKQSTGVDVARLAPKGADWDDDDDMAVSPSPRTANRGPVSSSGYPREDARSFSGRDLQEDFQKAFGTMGGGGGTGSYGFGGGGVGSSAYVGGSGASGNYGMGGGGTSYPVSPPSYRKGGGGSDASGMGLKDQVNALESEIFQKTYQHDPLPVRVNRLEATVFPNDKTLADKALPERVANLVAKIPISNGSNNRKVARADRSDDLDDLMNGTSMSNIPTTTMSTQTPQQKNGGLGKIINSIGNMLSGGNSYGYGGYPMSGGALMTDPSSGMLYDPNTGNLINPQTGQIVGRRAPMYNNYGGGYGSPYGYGGGFSNGFSPYGSSVNRPGFGFGMGGGGMRMGGLGGMWP